MAVKQYKNVKHEIHSKQWIIHKDIGKRWDYRLGTVSGECHWGVKPGLRAPNLAHTFTKNGYFAVFFICFKIHIHFFFQNDAEYFHPMTALFIPYKFVKGVLTITFFYYFLILAETFTMCVNVFSAIFFFYNWYP